MASAPYLALLEKHASHGADLKVLVEIQTRRELRGDWTSEGSGDYSRDVSLYTHSAALRADLGLYLGLTAVYANATALTARASVAAVKAASEGYFYDNSTGKLHVKTTGGTSPDNTALVTAHGLLRLATTDVNFSDQPPYDARLTVDQLPSVRQARPDLLRGIASFADGNVTLNNADGLFDHLVGPLWHWINNPVTFKLGGDDLAYSDYETVAVMQLAKTPTAGSRLCVVELRSRLNALSRAFPQHTFDQWDATQAIAMNLSGLYMPMGWGVLFDVPLTVFIPTGGSGSRRRCIALDPFQFQIGHALTATAVYKVEKTTRVRSAVSDFLSGLANGYIDVDASLSPDDYDFFADVATVTFPGGLPAFRTCGSIAQIILTGQPSGGWNGCGVPIAEIDTASFAQADADNPAPLGVYAVKKGATGRTFFDVVVNGEELIDSPSRESITKSTLCHVYIGVTGLWTAKVWDPSFDFLNLTILTERELLAFDPVPEVTEGLVPNVTVHYRPNLGSGSSLTTSATSTEREAALGSQETEHVETALADLADAALHAGRLQLVGSRPAQQFAIRTGPVLMNANVGDKIRIMRTRGPGAPTPWGDTAWDKVLEIEAVNKHLATQQVHAIVGNMRGIDEKIRRVAPDGTPDWASASNAERRAYAFVHDDTTERVDPSDPATWHQAEVW